MEKSLKQTIKHSLVSGLVFFGTVTLLSLGYATWNANMVSVGSGSGLTSTGWNAIVDNINDLNTRVGSAGVPTGAVQYFAMQACPSGWTEANGGTISNTPPYDTLYALLGTTFGSAGKLPNLQGEFIRGWDHGR